MWKSLGLIGIGVFPSQDGGLGAAVEDLPRRRAVPGPAEVVAPGGGGRDRLAGAVGGDLVAGVDVAARDHADDAGAVAQGDGPALRRPLDDAAQGPGGPR